MWGWIPRARTCGLPPSLLSIAGKLSDLTFMPLELGRGSGGSSWVKLAPGLPAVTLTTRLLGLTRLCLPPPPRPPPQPPGSCAEERGPGRAAHIAATVRSRPDRVLVSRCGCVLAPGRRMQGAKKARANVLGVWMAAWLQGGLTPAASAPAPALLDPGCVAPGHTGEPQGLWLRVCGSGMGQVPRGSCGVERLRGQLGRSPPSVHSQTSSHSPFQSGTDFSFLNFTSRHKFGQESRWGN